MAVRRYYYYLDSHGQLFLHDTFPRNFMSCFKDKRFLNFFFSRVKPNTEFPDEPYPYVSPCGREVNFIEVEDRPIVFHDFTSNRKELVWAGDKTVPFEPSLVSATENGQLYYPSPLASLKDTRALIRPAITATLTPLLDVDDNGRYSLTWEGKQHLLAKEVSTVKR